MKKIGMLSAATIALLFGVTAAAAQSNNWSINDEEDLKQAIGTDHELTPKRRGQNKERKGNASQTTGQSQQDTQTPQKRTPREPAAQVVPAQPAPQTPTAAPRATPAPQPAAQGIPTTQPATSQQGATPTVPAQPSVAAPTSPAPAQPSAAAPTPPAPAQPTVAAPATPASAPSSQLTVNDQQRLQIATVIRSQRIEPVTNVNFAITVGTRVPSSVRLTVLSDDIAQIAPQFRGHFFFVAQDQLVIVEPRTTQIVALIPISGPTTTVAVTSPATQQSPAPQARTIAPQMIPAPQATTMAPANAAQVGGEWRGSKLIGLNVYNNNKEKIGSIKELMLDQNGNVQIVVIGVGGFVGIREHDVAVSFTQITWATEPATTTRSSPTSRSGSARNYPDHAVLNATKEQLKATAAFPYKQ